MRKLSNINVAKKTLSYLLLQHIVLMQGFSTTLGVITSAGVIAAETAVPTGGISILIIIACAGSIIAIVAILNNTDYELSIDWKNMTITLKLKKHN